MVFPHPALRRQWPRSGETLRSRFSLLWIQAALKKGRSAFLGFVANRTLSNVTVHRKPVEVAALPLPAGVCCSGGTSVLFRPPTPCPTRWRGMGRHGLALLLWATRTRQGLTGSVQNLSKRAIPNHSAVPAGVFTHSALRLHGNPKPLRQRTSPPTEGWSSLPSHHGFTVRYGSLVCLRPTRFHLTVDTLPLWAMYLKRGNLQEQDFHPQVSVPASRTIGKSRHTARLLVFGLVTD